MSRFESFVMLAGMRTGSNLLEERLNALEGVTCHGEAFNPVFVGFPDQESLLGIDAARREAAPETLLAALAAAPGLNGFRLFPGHDERVLRRVLDDPRCAKIILTRDPLHSYLSLAVARETGQWKITGPKGLKLAQVRFEEEDFHRHADARDEFLATIHRRLQVTGQPAFRLDYGDLGDGEVIDGLARFLGVPAAGALTPTRLKPQNTAPLDERVINPAEMRAALARWARPSLGAAREIPAEPDALLSAVIAVMEAPLLYLPVGSGPDAAVEHWLRGFGALTRRMSRQELDEWRAAQPGHLAFSVLRHPVARAHAAFARRVLGRGARPYAGIRDRLVRFHDLSLPEEGDLKAEKAAFRSFLKFLGHNLAGRTGIRRDPDWIPQGVALRGHARHALPARILREEEMAQDLPEIAARLGLAPQAPVPEAEAELAALYDEEIEQLTRAAYARDYLEFGFGDFTAG